MLEIRLLGQFKVTAGNQPVGISSRPAQSLLAYLAITAGIAHRREKLAGMLWPDIPEIDARRNLRRALWQVRKATGDLTPIHADELSIAFAESDTVWGDALALSHSNRE